VLGALPFAGLFPILIFEEFLSNKITNIELPLTMIPTPPGFQPIYFSTHLTFLPMATISTLSGTSTAEAKSLAPIAATFETVRV
jgi:hypothetical protein